MVFSRAEWKQRISSILDRPTRTDLQGQGKSAAVLVPLFWKEERPYLLLTKRTRQVEHHKGEIAFPGGAKDQEDASLAKTVCRESWEEIGLEESQIEILGVLDDTATMVSSFIITPFVAWVPYPYSFQLNAVETEEILEIPFHFFLDRHSYEFTYFCYENQKFPTHLYRWAPDKVIWGATARIIYGFCARLRAVLYGENAAGAGPMADLPATIERNPNSLLVEF